MLVLSGDLRGKVNIDDVICNFFDQFPHLDELRIFYEKKFSVKK